MAAKAKPTFDQYPLFTPQSDWQSPTELPDLSKETEIAIDTETRDDLLGRDRGPGFYAYERGSNTGFICGISAAWRDQSIYIPIRHYDSDCLSMSSVASWLKYTAAQSHTRFIFHNFQYDWGWLEAVFRIPPPTLLDDTAAMASMVNENLDSFSLDALCQWQGLPGKDESLLLEVMGHYKVKVKDTKKYLWQLPARFVGPYAEQDARSTLELAQRLRPLLAEEQLENAYQIERDLFPITLKMKQRGIRVDVVKTNELKSQIEERCKEDLYKLSCELRQKVEIKHIRSNRWLQTLFDERGWDYPRTGRTAKFPIGQPSFEKNFMEHHQEWIPRTIHKAKHWTDMSDKFLQKFILDYQHHSRVHPTVNQFRSEEGGARSHRFSYSDPALQQIPSRDDDYANLIRSCFIPEDGEIWCSIDYRQQEYRLIVFVAEMLRTKGAVIAANRYRKDPSTDFHDYVAAITRLPRRRAKDVNFAKSYGAGVKKFALMTGMNEEEAKTTMEQYDRELPFVRETAEWFTRRAADRGYIKMIDGARGHFNQWEPVYRDYALEYERKKDNPNIDTSPCGDIEYASRKNDPKHPWYGEREKLAFTHKAFNRMIQGSAARQIKKAMVDIYKAGFQPILQLHDELCFSLASKKDAQFLAEIMENAVPSVTIPMTTDIEFGPSWGELKK
jgi:DNA polymerase I-like protein with 3'-5' exonuclease and polymerase domains